MSKPAKRYGMCGFESGIVEQACGPFIHVDDYDDLSAERNELLGLLREANETYYRFINDDPDAVSSLANIMYLVRETLERHKC